MRRAQQDETLRMRTKREKSRCVAPLRVLCYQATPVVYTCHGLGMEKKMDRAQQDETLRMRKKKGKSRCVAPLRVLSYRATRVVKACHGLGRKREKRWEGAARRDA